MEKVTLENLSEEQRYALLQEFMLEQKTKSNRIKNERETYKKMVSDEVQKSFPLLRESSESLSKVKTEIFDNFNSLIKMKTELYDRKEGQQSHTFSNEDGSISITLGYNMMDGWDDTAEVGIGKVNDYLQSLISDKVSQTLVSTIMELLARDTKGNLKASRVLRLKKIADQTGDEGFVDSIRIIQDAYRPVRTKEFIRCEFRGEKGEKTTLPLSITETPFVVKEEEKV